MVVDGEGAPISGNKATTETGARETTVEGEQERLENLLFDNPDHGEAVGHIAAQEVRVVSAKSTGRLGSMLGLLLLFFLLLGAGYYFLSTPQILTTPPPQIDLYVSPRLAVPVRVATAEDVDPPPVSKKETPLETMIVKDEISLFTVMVGPLVNASELEQTISQLRDLGLKPQEKKGRGQVEMIRLLQGLYPENEARSQLEILKKVVKSAFILPEGDRLAVYAGSFHQQSRAMQMQEDLARKKVNVSLVNTVIPMNRTMLIALQADEKTAREVAAHITSFGIQTQVNKDK